ncbi:glycosyltransferase [Oxalobacteraceae bacterium CAVE-383]|nr:glycosyltransferase [Oxalobacteraceae bacterium CAVE-383]
MNPNQATATVISSATADSGPTGAALLERALIAASPRLSPRGTTLAGAAIHFSVALLWLLLFARAFFLHGALAWSTGIVYVMYDTALLLFVGFKTLPLIGLRQTAEAAAVQPLSRLPSLGVIVAAHNEASVLPITIARLLEQPHGPVQIVIADDGSSDGSAELLRGRFGLAPAAEGELSAPSVLHPQLFWLRVPHGGKARALNAAITVMTTDIVMTVDADTLLENAASHAMRSAFAARPGLVAATGILTPVCSRTVPGRILQWFQTHEYMRNFISRYAWMRTDSLLLISGAFASFRRDALLAVGGFDPQCLVEDYELIHRLRRYSVERGLGWDVRVIGDAHARTDAPSTLQAFLRQRRRWFAGFLQTQYWNRDMTGNRRYGALGLLMMPVKAIDTLQPLYGLTAFALLLAFAFHGRGAIVLSIFGVIGAKTLFDLLFYVWSIHLYRRWTGETRQNTNVGMAMLAAIAEPFTFQLLRHFGALLGWLEFVRGGRVWGKQHRAGITATPSGD